VRSLGLSVGEIFAVYFLKVVLVASLGVAMGVAVGLGLCQHFQRPPSSRTMASWFGRSSISGR